MKKRNSEAAVGMINSVDPDQTALSDLVQHLLCNLSVLVVAFFTVDDETPNVLSVFRNRSYDAFCITIVKMSFNEL